ncbi:hypothetical protein TSUD_260140 [Trifolium subterraneum]|uniref:Uncharacterized protein n=1 Tax=Trifolium subterraneum TaxID=3900 RepID=A0A2Z6MPU0_TRISU|nr:hypothetical protein TSUD_260140 [Trifolium subterraneum]
MAGNHDANLLALADLHITCGDFPRLMEGNWTVAELRNLFEIYYVNKGHFETMMLNEQLQNQVLHLQQPPLGEGEID